jgi:hypothetical protein
MSDDELKKIEGVPNACCRDPKNIELLPTANPTIIIRRCAYCGCNHYLMLAEPMELGSEFTPI